MEATQAQAARKDSRPMRLLRIAFGRQLTYGKMMRAQRNGEDDKLRHIKLGSRPEPPTRYFFDGKEYTVVSEYSGWVASRGNFITKRKTRKYDIEGKLKSRVKFKGYETLPSLGVTTELSYNPPGSFFANSIIKRMDAAEIKLPRFWNAP